jgi:hypothetical protein
VTPDPATDLLLRALQQLPHAEPDPNRTTLAKARCHAAIDRVRRRGLRASRRRRLVRRVAEPVLVGGLGLIYLLAVMRDAFRIG